VAVRTLQLLHWTPKCIQASTFCFWT
jgi:hypothetical protein